MRAVVFGAGGTLGQALAAQLPSGGHDVVGSFAGRKDGDITDAALVASVLDRLRPEVVFNAAAWTDVDGAEDHPQEARRANAEGPEGLARACAARGIHLVHYSTDFVFDGERETPYDESVVPSPQSVYAATKLEGERRVEAACPQSFVLRVGCLYGRNGRNFPSTILRRLRAGELIRADFERRVSPTWVVPVAQLSARLAGTRHFGLYHSTAQGETCWSDFARFVADAAGLPDARVEAVAGSALKLKAARPRRAVLISRRLPELGLDPLPTWQEQARAYIASES
jgi:dTDP-4-dehydrorhamnose reductase